MILFETWSVSSDPLLVETEDKRGMTLHKKNDMLCMVMLMFSPLCNWREANKFSAFFNSAISITADTCVLHCTHIYTYYKRPCKFYIYCCGSQYMQLSSVCNFEFYTYIRCRYFMSTSCSKMGYIVRFWQDILYILAYYSLYRKKLIKQIIFLWDLSQ